MPCQKRVKGHLVKVRGSRRKVRRRSHLRVKRTKYKRRR